MDTKQHMAFKVVVGRHSLRKGVESFVVSLFHWLTSWGSTPQAAQMKRRGFATTECHSFLDPTLTLRFGVEEVGKGVRAEGRERREEMGLEGISAETGRVQEGPPIPQPFQSTPPSTSPANNLSSSYFGLKITYSRKPPAPG